MLFNYPLPKIITKPSLIINKQNSNIIQLIININFLEVYQILIYLLNINFINLPNLVLRFNLLGKNKKKISLSLR
jgi:hypothetical protein